MQFPQPRPPNDLQEFEINSSEGEDLDEDMPSDDEVEDPAATPKPVRPCAVRAPLVPFGVQKKKKAKTRQDPYQLSQRAGAITE